MRPTLLALACAVAPLVAHAAGGHYEVDDATVVGEGRCQVEAWATHATRRAAGDTAHVGPACRVGAFELGLNVDQRHDDTGVARTAGPAVKWVVDPLVPRLSAGLSYNAAFDLKPGAKPAHTLVAPFTLFPGERVQLHANLGADWSGGTRLNRAGVAGEWTVDDRFSVIGERIRRLGDSISRVGARWMLNDDLGLDVSVARSRATGARIVAVGLNQEFRR